MSRASTAASIIGSGGKRVESIFTAHTAVTTAVARRFGLDERVAAALPSTFARWDGNGILRGVGGTDIPMPVRLMVIADMAEVHNRIGGVDGAIAMARKHSGRLLAPDAVRSFCESAGKILSDLDDPWKRVVDEEPLRRPPLTASEVDSALEVIADIADLKSPWFAGHSRGVASLASAAVAVAGMPDADVGCTAIPNTVWDKPGPLTEGEMDRMRLHTYYTERILRRPAVLAGLAVTSASHHERLDGSGYTAPFADPRFLFWGATSQLPMCITRSRKRARIVPPMNTKQAVMQRSPRAPYWPASAGGCAPPMPGCSSTPTASGGSESSTTHPPGSSPTPQTSLPSPTDSRCAPGSEPRPRATSRQAASSLKWLPKGHTCSQAAGGQRKPRVPRKRFGAAAPGVIGEASCDPRSPFPPGQQSSSGES